MPDVVLGGDLGCTLHRMTLLDSSVPAVEYVDLHGYRMAYREWGDSASARVVVLVHGITSSSLTWIRVGPALASGRRVIAVDLKGHGDSDRPEAGYLFSDQAREVAELCHELGLGEVCLIGHSWGGAVAALVAAETDLRLRRLVLEDPALGSADSAWSSTDGRRQAAAGYVASVGLTREQAEERARPNLALGWTEEDVAGKIDAAMKGSPAAVQAVFTENGGWNVINALDEIRCETLLVRAENARGGIVTPDAVARAQANPLVRVVTIPEADHNIHRGQFGAFMAEVEPFVDGAFA